MNGEPPQQSTAVKASTAWPMSHNWWLETAFSLEEDMDCSLCSQAWLADDDADCITEFVCNIL